MLRLQKKESILKTLRNREIGSSCSAYKLTLSILHRLIISEDRHFQETWKKKSNKRIHQDAGKLFFENFTSVFSVWGASNTPEKCYQIACPRAKHKIMDVLMCPCSDAGPVSPNETVDPTSLEGYILVLFKDNWLHSFHLETGALRKEIYLGDHKIQFKHCDWDIYRKQITVMSNTHHQRVTHVAVFTVAPLEYRAMLSIKKSIFVPKCSTLNVSDSMLVVGLGTLSNGIVRIYSFSHVLDENISYAAKLGEACPYFDNEVVGSYPAGIPVNCEIKQLPPILFEVPCANLNVNFGGYPWHYLLTPPKHKSVFNVRKVADHVLAINGELSDQVPMYEEGAAHFHFDGSERIIHVMPNSINIYRLIPDNQTSRVELISRMGFLTKKKEKEREKRVSTRPQRKSALYTPEFCDISDVKSVLCMDYESELDLTVILGFNPNIICEEEKIKAQVNLYDNFTGALDKSIELSSLIINECDDYSLYMELDTLVILVRSFRHGCYICYIFKLTSE